MTTNIKINTTNLTEHILCQRAGNTLILKVLFITVCFKGVFCLSGEVG